MKTKQIKNDMKLKRFFTIIGLCGMVITASAQKKELHQAEDMLKSGKNFDKAEKLMTDLLKKSEYRENLKVYAMWYKTVEAQYNEANTKLYLKEKYDTAKFFGLAQRMYQVAEALDSLDARPDRKGRVRPDYRHKNAQQLNMLRYNLYYGGTYHMRRNDYNRAYGFFSTYLDTETQPLFKGYDYGRKDTLMSQAAYWAMTCGYLLHRPDSVLQYARHALQYKPRLEYVMQYMCEAYQWQQNDSAYVEALNRGFETFPEHSYFFPRLADWYSSHEKADSMLMLAEKGLEINPDNQLFLLGKSVAQLHSGDEEGCIETSEHLIALNDTLPEAYFNVATVRLNQALTIEQEREPRKNHRRLTTLYRQARPYMEAYRKLAPTEKRRWAPALYRIYLNLNMGKQFDEIDRVLKKLK